MDEVFPFSPFYFTEYLKVALQSKQKKFRRPSNDERGNLFPLPSDIPLLPFHFPPTHFFTAVENGREKGQKERVERCSAKVKTAGLFPPPFLLFISDELGSA
jgi:hypothetical protein